MSVDDENESVARHERAHQYWTSLLAERPMPSITDLTAERLSEFKDHSFLIAISGPEKNHIVSFAGKNVFAGDGAPALKAGTSLDSVAGGSLLSLLRAEFSNIENNPEPLLFDLGDSGVGDEFSSMGMLMPFGTDDTVQFIWGVLGSKTTTSASTMVEPDNFPVAEEESFSEKEQVSGFDAYADTYEEEAFHIADVATEERSDLGTGEVAADIYLGFDDRADTYEKEAYEMSEVVTQETSIVFYDEGTDFDNVAEPETNEGFAGGIAEAGEDNEFDGFVDMEGAELQEQPQKQSPEEKIEEEVDPEPTHVEPSVENEVEEAEEGEAEEAEDEATEEEVPFFNLLADGRTAADGVVHVDQRSRLSLYEVLAKAFALYEESQGDRETYLSILKATGIREQARAPFTPIIKLVFGKDFDKTRITEYAAALSFARREGQNSETLPEFLANHPGGIKGCVQAERIAKRKEKGIAGDVALEAAKDSLRQLKAIGQVNLELVGDDEFVLLLGKRSTKEGVVKIIKQLDEKRSFVDPMIKRAVKPS